MTKKSLFITFEGPNGVGKTTVIADVAKKLDNLGYDILLTKEPTKSSLGEFLRAGEELYKKEILACIAAADRYFHIEKEIIPALSTGKIILSDRYIESSLALQCLDGCSIEFVWNINSKAIIPDLSVILIADPEIIRERLTDNRTKLTRFEREKTREEEIYFYNQAAKFIAKKGFNVLLLENNKKHIDDISNRIVSEIKELLRDKQK